MPVDIQSHDRRETFHDFHWVDELQQRLNGILRGKPDVVRQVVIGLLGRGHLLIEDRPGLGKTTLAKELAEGVGGRFARVQCTPDLLPSDITGFNIFNQKTREFEFRRGPVFANVLLADEINRATPRTQSALLEAMAEQQVTVDGERYPLAEDFFVIATQNPHEHHGTYPLPEAQLDRFAMKLSIGYAGAEEELAMLENAIGTGAMSEPREPLLPDGCLASLQTAVTEVTVVTAVQKYLIRVAKATREHRQVTLGLSPRGLLIWQRMGQATAWLNHRTFVTPDDVQEQAQAVLGVRLGVSAADPRSVIQEIMDAVPVPEFR